MPTPASAATAVPAATQHPTTPAAQTRAATSACPQGDPARRAGATDAPDRRGFMAGSCAHREARSSFGTHPRTLDAPVRLWPRSRRATRRHTLAAAPVTPILRRCHVPRQPRRPAQRRRRAGVCADIDGPPRIGVLEVWLADLDAYAASPGDVAPITVLSQPRATARAPDRVWAPAPAVDQLAGPVARADRVLHADPPCRGARSSAPNGASR